MSWKRPDWRLTLTALVLSLSGCASPTMELKPVSIPSLPKDVIEQAQSSSTIPSEVSSWRQDVLKTLENLSKP